MPSPVILLGSTSDSARGINFREYTSSKLIMPTVVNSVKAITAEGAISVYPNPAARILNINWNSNTTGIAHVVITDMTGRAVFRSAADISAAAGKTTIDLGDLKSGVYFVAVKSDNIFYTSKLLIQQ
jgi:hypothetical protein